MSTENYYRSRNYSTSQENDSSPVIFPLASDGGCQFTIMVRGFPSLLTTVTSLGGEDGTGRKVKDKYDFVLKTRSIPKEPRDLITNLTQK